VYKDGGLMLPDLRLAMSGLATGDILKKQSPQIPLVLVALLMMLVACGSNGATEDIIDRESDTDVLADTDLDEGDTWGLDQIDSLDAADADVSGGDVADSLDAADADVSGDDVADALMDTVLPPDRRCNGSEDLCSRPFDFTVFVTTHNAMSNEEDGWAGPNQGWNMLNQLNAGVRAMMIDLYVWDNERKEPESPWLCHGSCAFGSKRLSDALVELRDWLLANPREVVTLILENLVPGNEVIKTFEEAGLGPFLHAQVPGEAWPTLGSMIDDGRRLVVFTLDLQGGDAPWFMAQSDHAWENHFAAKRKEDMKCDRHKGDEDNPLFILNHFLSAPIGSPDLAQQVNFNPFLSERTLGCRNASGRQVNFLAVDFCDIGDVFTTVDALNAVPWHSRDDELRINHIQLLGTHNSYHIDPGEGALPQWKYTHAPLDEQLQFQMVRSIELDIYFRAEGGFSVHHIPLFDDQTTCESLDICLGLVKDWSDSHPWHVPLMILIEPKEILGKDLSDNGIDKVDAAIRAVLGDDRIITPDDVRGSHATLREALEADGWPTLAEARGKVMFLMLDNKENRTTYLEEHPNLEGRVMFARGGKDEPWSAILEYGNPERDEAEIIAAVQAGYLVRTHVGGPVQDAETAARRLEIALRSGAHVISTDFPVDPGDAYAVTLPDKAPANCNPVTTADMQPSCRSGDVE